MSDLSGWVPMRIFWRDATPMVDWGHLGPHRFTDPFFAQTISRCVRHPADLLFRHQTPLENLGEIAGAQAGLRPTGFIFHMSRCGSTLISQMLAATPQNIVLSEPNPIDDVLRSHFRHPAITEPQRIQWLQWLASLLARPRHPAERNLFIKFDCWHALFVPLIQRAFPGVPCIFLYREPIEVMASHAGHRGAQMLPGVLEPEMFGWDAKTVGRMAMDEYGARVLAAICDAALVQARGGNLKLVNYRQLPNPIWPALLKYWKLEFPMDESARMMDAAGLNAKNPVLPFTADSEGKRASASERLRALTQSWLTGVYEALEAQRMSGGFGP